MRIREKNTMEGNYNRIMEAVYGTLWAEEGLILGMEFTDHGETLWIKVPKSNVKAHPVARSKHDCVYLVNIYSVEWISFQKDYADNRWTLTLCDASKKPIITDTVFDECIYLTKEKEDEPIYIDRASASYDYESFSEAYERICK